MKKVILRNSAVILISKIIGFVAYYLTIPLLIRILDLELYGFWLIISSFISWILVFDFGIGHTLKNSIVKCVESNNTYELRQLISTTYFIVFLLSLGIVALLCLLISIDNFSTFLNVPGSLKDRIQLYLIILISGSGMTIILKLITSILSGYQQTGLAEAANSLVLLLIYCFVYKLSQFQALGFDVFTIIVLVYSLVPIVVYGFVSLYFFRFKASLVSPSYKFIDLSKFGLIMKESLNFFLIQLSGLVIYSTDSFIISHLFDNTKVTIYNLAFRYFQILILALNVVLTPIWPLASKLNFVGDYMGIIRIKNRLLISLIFYACISILLIFLQPFIFDLWIGEGIFIPKSLIIIFAIYSCVAAMGNVYAVLLNSMGELKVQRNVSILLMFVNIPLCYLFASFQKIGFLGIPLASIVCLLISGSAVYFEFRKKTNLWNVKSVVRIQK